MPLFDRIGKQVVATEAGELLRLHGRRMLDAERDAKAAIKELLTGERGTVRLGVLPSDLDFQLVPLFTRFNSEYPDIQLQVFSSIAIQDEVLNQRVDLGIGLESPPDKRFVQIPLGSEHYHLFVRSDSDLASKPAIKLIELQHLPLVMYPQGFLGRDLVDTLCRTQGFQLATVMETSTATSLLQLVRAGVGATIQPEGLLRQAASQTELVAIPIIEHPPARRLELIYIADRYVSRAHQQLIQWLIDFFSNMLNHSNDTARL